MKRFALVCAALALLVAPHLAPAQIVTAPAGNVTSQGVGYGAIGGAYHAVTPSDPLPVTSGMGPSGITPIAGTVSTTTTTNSAALTPALGRPVIVTLSGTWVGTAQLYRSTNGGTTWLPITAGGQPWAVFTSNANEQVLEETDSAATLRLTVTLTSGSLTYRVAQ